MDSNHHISIQSRVPLPLKLFPRKRRGVFIDTPLSAGAFLRSQTELITLDCSSPNSKTDDVDTLFVDLNAFMDSSEV